MAMVLSPALQLAPDSASWNDADPKTITWERLENIRLKRLGLKNKYSRHFNVTRSYKSEECEKPESASLLNARPPPAPVERAKTSVIDSASRKSNSVAPFSTVGKPTCGYFFSWHTVNKKQKIGIPASDLVKWRNFEK